MNILIIIGIIAVILVYMMFKFHSFRSKFAFFFILFGVLVVLFFLYLVTTGSTFNFSSIGTLTSYIRIFFLWIKGALGHVFETTGKTIGIKGQYIQYVGNNATG